MFERRAVECFRGTPPRVDGFVPVNKSSWIDQTITANITGQPLERLEAHWSTATATALHAV